MPDQETPSRKEEQAADSPSANDEEPWRDPDYDPDEEEDEDEEGDEGGRMPFMAHLEELRNRLMYSLYAVAGVFVVAFIFKEKLYSWLVIPLRAALPPGSKLIYTNPAEAFFTYIKLAFLAGVIGASPIIFFQMWRFIGPGLHSHEKKAVWPFVVTSSALFLVGSAFAFKIVFPFAFQFFMSFATDYIQPMISVKEYLSFSMMLLFAFGIVFQMPLVLVFLARLGVVNSGMLRRNRKYAILIMFVVGALFTPPDPLTQILLAVPLIALFELSIWLVRSTEKKKAQRQAEAEADFSG